MRAATTVSRTRRPFRKRNVSPSSPRAVCLHAAHPHRSVFFFLCGGCFLFGYLPGILVGRSGTTNLGQQLATYYMDDTRYRTWFSLFTGQIASSFLQSVLVWLCGFTVFGLGLLLLLFVFKGLFLGFCCANVLTLGNAKALCLYWLSDCLPGVLLLFVLLWLAEHSSVLSRGLFQSVFLGGAPRGQLAVSARRLTVCFLFSLLLSCLLCLLCSGGFFFLFRVFLR